MTWRGTMRVFVHPPDTHRNKTVRRAYRTGYWWSPPLNGVPKGCDHPVEAPTREQAQAKAIKEHREVCEK